MKGIISYGAYIPYNRLPRRAVAEFFGSPALLGERAVAGYDEDSTSMGVEAARDCLKGFDEKAIDRLIFATTTSSYDEKQSATTMAMALDLRPQVQTLEAAHSLRSATSSMISSISDPLTLLVASDSRLGAPNGQNEQVFGDGAAAFLMGSDEQVIAQVIDSVSFREEVVGQWRSRDHSYVQTWEDRFMLEVFLQSVSQSVSYLASRNGFQTSDLQKVIISGPGVKAHLAAARALGLKKEQIQDPLFENIGACGNAHAPMMLIAALEEAKPKDRILLVNFAEGTDVILFEVTDAILKLKDRKGIRGQLEPKNNKVSYSDYLKWKGLIDQEPPRRPETQRPSAPAMFRNYGQNLGFYGSKCIACGAPQFPKQRVCAVCQAKDQMEPYRFIDKEASIATYTIDYLAASPAPPTYVAVIDFEGGGRIMCEVTDCEAAELQIGMQVEMTFRKLYQAGGIHNYFWKAKPKR